MDDWQGCLTPECQTALVHAHRQVEQRGGAVVTIEDFLLSLLETVGTVPRFLKRRGVDLDELVRTIQCEQPIITGVGDGGVLSSQLTDWLAQTREIHAQPWLGGPELLAVLVRGADRFQAKAYVAVLERVTDWPVGQLEPRAANLGLDAAVPVVIADTRWAELADQVSVALSASANALVWVRGERGSGKSCWLRHLLQVIGLDCVEVDLRREQEVLASESPAVPAGAERPWPVLVLDNLPPPDLLARLAVPSGLASALVPGWHGPILLLGPDRGDERAVGSLESWLGREVRVMDMVPCGRRQRLAIVTAHQPLIEKAWNVQLTGSALAYAAACRDPRVASPGGLLQWLRRAAARLDLLARRGPAGAVALRGQQDTLERQALVALARRECTQALETSRVELERKRALALADWQARERAGNLRRLLAEDLHRELEQWLAAEAPPGHYVRHQHQQQGESASAGPGDLHP
ncbi:hypothetical protein BTO32_09220 [Marinobacter lutaoensis]|uniref:Uncharacterized protein n=1 Tax=Marinobacter lutaoensis TaxID=135739 RepID=A0A1V2DT59_9GAMM|nr:hypothetical protein [Marinobacter lutaoensis]ONF43822.1 hypothetical protein BTO32_09220 [Marinobacter lutaoensis]